ncbi:NAD(P)-dependent oxidoreductase [bacterium]|nr:NAD(P)-dependent oxidoreductase [bacterium]
MEIKSVGWIGTGVMGKSMCSHLITAGYPAFVFNRTRTKAEELLKMGAAWCGSPAEVAGKSDIVFSIVGYPMDVEEIYFGQQGIFSASPRCTTVVDMTTSEPRLAQTIFETAAQKSIHALDAPVSGGDIGAREGKLAIMVGGEAAVFEAVLPLFQIMGENIALMGTAGAGQHTKMANQIKIAATMIGVVESLLYGYKAGLDLNKLLDVIGKGAAGSWSLNNLGRRIANGDFDPGFFIKHFVKDMGIALAEARAMQLALPGLALAHQFYVSAMALGYQNLGTQALYKVFAKMSGAKI